MRNSLESMARALRITDTHGGEEAKNSSNQVKKN